MRLSEISNGYNNLLARYASEQYANMSKRAGGAYPASGVSPTPQEPRVSEGRYSEHPAFDATFMAAIRNNQHIGSNNVQYGKNSPDLTYTGTQFGRGGFAGIHTNYVC